MSLPSTENESLKARVFDGKGWNKSFVEGALIHDLWAEVERLRGELAYVSGFLLEHRQMLKDTGTHPNIVEAVLWLENRIAERVDIPDWMQRPAADVEQQ